ncbi:hypothetical protein [Bacillus infantis]|uniref:hypothetical protein n=1 Tax=Bacillus infantis TaxID=324767 RepID=UPI003CF9BFB0
MTTMTVKLCVKEPKAYLNYHLSTFKVNQNVNFPLQINVEEVKSLPKKQRKEFIKTARIFLATTTSFLTLTSKSMAATLNTQTPQLATTGLPVDLVEPIMELIKLAIGGSVLLSVLLLIAAGTMRQLRKKKEASEWTTDIIKGFLQVLISTPLIFLLYYVVTLLLGNFQMFLKPF